MEDSLKGVIVATTLGCLVIMGILNFLYFFPTEQGVDLNSDSDYLSLASSKDINITGNLSSISSTTETGFNKWNIEVGFMGSNTMKGTSTSAIDYKTTFFDRLTILAQQVFETKEGVHPVLYVLGVLASVAGTYLLYLVIKMIRTGT